MIPLWGFVCDSSAMWQLKRSCTSACVSTAAAQDVPSGLVLRRSANGELLRKSALGPLFGLLAAILLADPAQQPGAPPPTPPSARANTELLSITCAHLLDMDADLREEVGKWGCAGQRCAVGCRWG